jgi:hypothetical protein
MAAFTAEERNVVVAELARIWGLQMAPGGYQGDAHSYHVLKERQLTLQAEYAARLPRVVMGACPFTGDPLKRTLDPWGMEGPWWWAEAGVEMDEPGAPDAFRMLSGAADLKGREPREVVELVLPGPPVPYVIPRVLSMPGMVAVIAALDLPSGDRLYPISYWRAEKVDPKALHTPWLRATYWLPDDGGWMACNAKWDFDLAPWIKQGKLKWIMPGDEAWQVQEGVEKCPYLDLPGHQGPQIIEKGALANADPPTGEPFDPYADE